MDPIQQAFAQLGTVVNTNSTRLAAMCKVLMDKGIITQAEFDEAFKSMADEYNAQLAKVREEAKTPKIVRPHDLVNGNGRLHLGI